MSRRYPPQDGSLYSRKAVEDDNDELEENLVSKTRALKSLTINIGNEIRSQNSSLDNMDLDFDKSGGFLKQTMGRLQALARGGQNWHIIYLILFCFLVFFFLWLYIKLG